MIADLPLLPAHPDPPPGGLTGRATRFGISAVTSPPMPPPAIMTFTTDP